jgi:hypothetical protein
VTDDGSQLIATVRRMRALAEEHIEAAKSLNGARVAELNEMRTDLAYQLKVALAGADKESKAATRSPELTAEINGLATAEQRFATVVRSVLGVLAPFVPESETDGYTAKGQLRRS